MDEPQALQEPKPKKQEEPKLAKHVAYFLAHAIRNHSVLVENKGNILRDEAYVVLLQLLADDSVRKSESTEVERVYPRVHKAGSATF